MCIAAVPTIALIYRKQRSAGKSIILLTAQEVPICEKRAVAALLDSHCFPELFSTILYRYMCGATENSALDITPVVGWIHVFLQSQHSEWHLAIEKGNKETLYKYTPVRLYIYIYKWNNIERQPIVANGCIAASISLAPFPFLCAPEIYPSTIRLGR